MNLSNMKPIEYKFCEGSGKRKATMKKVKRNIKRGKKNKKPKKQASTEWEIFIYGIRKDLYCGFEQEGNGFI